MCEDAVEQTRFARKIHSLIFIPPKKASSSIKSDEDDGTTRRCEGHVATGQSRVREFGKVLRPDPSDHVFGIVLVLCQPQLALFCNDIEDLYTRSTVSKLALHGAAENIPLRLGTSNTGTRPHALSTRC